MTRRRGARQPQFGSALAEPSRARQAPTGMSGHPAQDEVISIEPRARAMLLPLVGAGGKARYVRIHVGRG
jgi:hypothetical protein